MPFRRITFWTHDADLGRRLDELLSEHLAESSGQPLSKGAVRRIIVAGAVSVNGRPVRAASAVLGPGARVEARVDLERLEARGAARARRFVMTEERILYEDGQLLVVDKPPGLPTHATLDAARDSLVAATERYLRERDGIENTERAPYLGLHQRLDRDTSGALLFAKDPAVNSALGRLFSERLVQKTYLALAVRPKEPPPSTWTVENYLGPAPRRKGMGKRTRYQAVRSGGAPARTDFRLLETFARGLLVEARPRTGRTHQIRVHLAGAGLPIMGDDLYGLAEGARPGHDSAGQEPPRLMLHASSLAFPHPSTGDGLVIESPLPEDFRAWLSRLRSEAEPGPG
ncbi:MAG: RluA family pseudouridine synthase [Polyangia bacterium]|jgi:RluA family pseudouridine synthase|nr:RluA family pseudouridine synthase [Polyangia bacterium]